MRKIKAIVFDLDGTLVKFTLDYRSLRSDVISALVRYGAPSSILSANESIFKTFDRAALHFRNDGAKEGVVERAYNEMIDICEKYEMEAAQKTEIMPGAEIALQSLRKLGLKMGLCTNNGLKAVRYLIKKYRLREYFDAIVTRESIP
ncbi:MAG TPA: HAD family hydrolase, partial [Candidatus Bathyarchaeia archaeon]|nr:HAD family hydrolase [Candidatus Bathyarchaeia archaeon]